MYDKQHLMHMQHTNMVCLSLVKAEILVSNFLIFLRRYFNISNQKTCYEIMAVLVK